MKRIVLSICSLALVLPLSGADKWKDEFAKHWQTTREFTIAVAEAMPAENYGFRPNEEEMSFGQLMAHIATANNNAFAMVSGMKAPAASEKIAAGRKDPNAIDKATAIQFLNDSFDFCTKALDQIGEDKLDAMTGPAGRQLSGRERLWSYFTHTAHHRGQAEVYMRVKNIKPPQYRF